MRILLLGERYSENLGDAVICETVKNVIKLSYSDAEIDMFDISGRTSYNEYYYDKQTSITKFHWKIYRNILKYRSPLFYKAYLSDIPRYRRTIKLFKAEYIAKNYDLAIFAGGALFMDYFAGIIFYLVQELSKKKCKIIFHACGMGELSDESVALLQNAFTNPFVKAISLRDSFSRFKSLFATANCLVTNTFDTALACSKYYKKSDRIIADFGVGVINIGQYYEEQKELISKFYYSNYSWKIFTNGAPWDLKVAYSILRDLGIQETEFQNYLVDRPLTAQELIYDITSFKRIVSYRMHSQIIAFSFLMPCYSFAWDEKVKSLFNKMKLDKFCFEPSEIRKCFSLVKSDNLNSIDLEDRVEKSANHSIQTLLKEISIVTERK